MTDTPLSQKYRIEKREIGWLVLCPCGSWVEKAMSFESAVLIFQRMLKMRVC